MSRSQPPRQKTLKRLFDEAVHRLSTSRRTFTEEEALKDIWTAGYNVAAQDDERFVLGREADGRSPRHWHLAGQVVANNRLIEALETDTWNGRKVDHELARLDQETGCHQLFCPVDDRLIVHPDGRVELADDEREVVLPQDVRSTLAALEDRFLERWLATGPIPWTVRQVTETLSELGWERARARGAWVQAGASGCGTGQQWFAWAATTGCRPVHAIESNQDDNFRDPCSGKRTLARRAGRWRGGRADRQRWERIEPERDPAGTDHQSRGHINALENGSAHGPSSRRIPLCPGCGTGILPADPTRRWTLGGSPRPVVRDGGRSLGLAGSGEKPTVRAGTRRAAGVERGRGTIRDHVGS